MHYSKKDLQELKQLLQKIELELKNEIELSKKSSQPVALDQQAVGRVSRIDAIQQQQLHLAALKRSEQRYLQILTALKRIDDDDFGLCKSCEEYIEIKRLKARPEAQICMGCAKNKS